MKTKTLTEVEKALIRNTIRRQRQSALIRKVIQKQRPKTFLERILGFFQFLTPKLARKGSQTKVLS